MSKFMHGSSLLLGNNTIPGVSIPGELEVLIPKILQECRDFGLDFYPTVVQMLTYDEMSEIASYGGFPVRYPHWKWGMEYEELQRGYEYGMHRIYELVINTSPCYLYCLNSNTLVDNITVIAHATGHNDFFKNNIFFAPTSQNMMNRLANNGTRIRRYMNRWGKEKVTEFIDHVLRLDTLVDPVNAWSKKEIKDPVIRDSRKYNHPKRLKVEHGYMEPWVNTEKWISRQPEDIERRETAVELGLFMEPQRDILGYLRDYAPLRPWQADIVAMLYEEAMYFAPQRATKVLNEGWASTIDFEIMAKRGFVGLGQPTHDCGIIDYARHKTGVLGGKYSMNPYKLGFYLFMDIEERWNKGRFGADYENCQDMKEKENWDEGVGLGKDKMFEVRKYYDDVNAIMEFFTEEFCNKYEFFEWEKFPNGEYKIKSRDHKSIKSKLVRRHLNGGLPAIQLVDPNYQNKRRFLLQHQWDGRVLYLPYVKATLTSIYALWQSDILLATRNRDSEEIVYFCNGVNEEDVFVLTREECEGLSSELEE